MNNENCNITHASYSYDKTIHELFEESVKKYPQHPAIYLENKNISYAELNKHTNQFAWYLREQGVGPNTIIGVDMDRSYEMIVAIFAILKAGGAYLPIDPHHPPARKQQIINDSKMKFLVVNNLFYTLDFNTDCRILNVQNNPIGNKSTKNLPKINSPHDLAYVIYTSGSTGTPKGVLIEHHALVNRIEWMQREFPLNVDDVLFQKTHYSFDVSVWEILWWPIAGAGVTLLPPEKEHDIILFTKLIKKYKVSVIHFVPSVLRIFLNYIETEFDLNKLNSLKYVFSSGEELDIDTVQKFNRTFPGKFPILINLYGPTEATIDVSYFVCDKINLPKQIPIGRPINNIGLFVLGNDLELLPLDTPGDLYISGVGLSRGYLNNSELTNRVFIQNPHLPGSLMYQTGDMAKWDHDEQLIFLGRKDDQVKLRGLRIELNEIRHHLIQHISVEDAIVLCVTDDNFQQTLAAFVILKNKELENNQTELIAFISNSLPRYMIPSVFIFLDTFPLKMSGKIDKAKLESKLPAKSVSKTF